MENVSESVQISKFQVFCYLETNWQKCVAGKQLKKDALMSNCQKHFIKYVSLKKNQMNDFCEDLKAVFEEWYCVFESR